MTKPKVYEPVENLYFTIDKNAKDGINLADSYTKTEILENPSDYAECEFAIYEFVGKVKLNYNPYFEDID